MFQEFCRKLRVYCIGLQIHTAPYVSLIYNSFIYRKLMSCVSSSGFTRTIHLVKINVAQKNTVGSIADVSFRELIAPISDELKLMKLKICPVYMCAQFVLKVMKFHDEFGWFRAQKMRLMTRGVLQ